MGYYDRENRFVPQNNAGHYALAILLLVFSTGFSGKMLADEVDQARPPAGLVQSSFGVTRAGTPLHGWLNSEDYHLRSTKTRVLLIAGIDGQRDSLEIVQRAIHQFAKADAAELPANRFLLSAAFALDTNASEDGSPAPSGALGFPPPANAFYNSTTQTIQSYLWRWLGMQAPDLVVVVRQGDAVRWRVPRSEIAALHRLAAELQAEGEASIPDDALVAQIVRVAPCETGIIPALEVTTPDAGFLSPLLAALNQVELVGPSPARQEMLRRLDRTPVQIASQLSEHYGHQLDQVVYIPAVALIGRLRLAELTNEVRHRQDVEFIVRPYVSGEKKPTIDNGSALSGHLIFTELAARSEGEQRQKYLELALRAANLGLDEGGEPRESMPFHLEMSDSLFMGGPILAHAGALTGNEKYFEACLRHLRFMRHLCLRDDGLYRHSPLDETAWGRGNGFPALGIALCLSHFPPDHPGRDELLKWFHDHMRSLLAWQDGTGCWHQVVDRPESYRELTVTCMVAFAMVRGIREGWLKQAEYEPAVERAWYAIRTRIGNEGRLVDVCTGTGKQKSLRDYYDRPAILGRDDRGGAMALLIATEMASQGQR